MADENTLLNSDLESRYEKYKGIIKNFTLMRLRCQGFHRQTI